MPVQVKPSQCAGCHTGRAFCRDCHQGLQMPHPKTWQRGHGQVVLDRGQSICVSCHLEDDPRFCIDCHGVVMPHPGDWRARHDNKAAKDKQVCVKCHGRNGCADCHGLPMPHPAGFSQTHPSAYYGSPGTCANCHSQSFCTGCHGVSLPHSSSFIANHYSYVYSNGGSCVKCHGNSGSGADGCYGGDCHSESPGD